MSIRSLAYPGRPLCVADELESFLHVTIFLAIRFVRSNCDSNMVQDFVRAYFDQAQHWEGNRYTASEKKEFTIEHAVIRTGRKHITFLTGAEALDQDGNLIGDQQPRHPLSNLLNALLKLFQARHAVEQWQRRQEESAARAKAASTAPQLPSLLSTMSSSQRRSTENRTSDPPDALFLVPQTSTETSTDSDRSSSGLSRPSQETFRQSGMLDDHNVVLGTFTSYLDSTKNEWPSDDKVGDQLHGYAPMEISANKKPRLVMRSTLPPIREGDEQPLRVQTGL